MRRGRPDQGVPRDGQAIKQNIGMNVVMDVVYNHTNEAGLGPKSVLDKIVPWYYQRLNPETGSVKTPPAAPTRRRNTPCSPS
jgi:hypothetical protein